VRKDEQPPDCAASERRQTNALAWAGRSPPGTARHLVGDRLEISGARWGVGAGNSATLCDLLILVEEAAEANRVGVGGSGERL
jgi:hypothetical protein